MKSISVYELNEMMQSDTPLHLLDIREANEREICQIPGSTFLPMNQAAGQPDELPRETTIVVYCHHGIRSYFLIRHLEENFGFKNLVNLDGGINQWAQEIDREMARY